MSIPTTITTIHHKSRTPTLSPTHNNNNLLITTTKLVSLILVKRVKSLKPILIICINHQISTHQIILGPIIPNNPIETRLIPTIIMKTKTSGHLMRQKLANKTYPYCPKIFPIAIMSIISIPLILT